MDLNFYKPPKIKKRVCACRFFLVLNLAVILMDILYNWDQISQLLLLENDKL